MTWRTRDEPIVFSSSGSLRSVQESGPSNEVKVAWSQVRITLKLVTLKSDLSSKCDSVSWWSVCLYWTIFRKAFQTWGWVVLDGKACLHMRYTMTVAVWSKCHISKIHRWISLPQQVTQKLSRAFAYTADTEPAFSLSEYSSFKNLSTSSSPMTPVVRCSFPFHYTLERLGSPQIPVGLSLGFRLTALPSDTLALLTILSRT